MDTKKELKKINDKLKELATYEISEHKRHRLVMLEIWAARESLEHRRLWVLERG